MSDETKSNAVNANVDTEIDEAFESWLENQASSSVTEKGAEWSYGDVRAAFSAGMLRGRLTA